MRTDRKSKVGQKTIAVSMAYWVEINSPYFYRIFKEKMKKSFEYDHSWLIYFQKYGLTLKTIQSVITEYSKKDIIITSCILDSKLKKEIKKTNKQIKKHGQD